MPRENEEPPMPGSTAVRERRRAGFTLVEMMMAMLLTVLVFAITVPFFRMQTTAVDVTAGRLDALQNARYAQNAIDRELRLAGGVTGQPLVVQAAPFAVTFNVDLRSRRVNDPNATYYDPTADSLSTESWLPARQKTLPVSTKMYPLVQYNDQSGLQSPAETISFMVYLDASSGRPDIYSLFRRVNDRDSTLISRNLWIPVDTNYFFRYYRTDATGVISQIPQASLPIYWDAANAPLDSVRVVEMRVAGLFRDVRKQKDVIRTIYHRTRLLNAGMLKERTCGSPPLPPPSANAVRDVTGSGATKDIRVTWTRSPEELGGEKDVATYLVQRQQGAGPWIVLANIVAIGTASYTYLDEQFQPGLWTYGVVAQDCTPSNSIVTSAPALNIP